MSHPGPFLNLFLRDNSKTRPVSTQSSQKGGRGQSGTHATYPCLATIDWFVPCFPSSLFVSIFVPLLLFFFFGFFLCFSPHCCDDGRYLLRYLGLVYNKRQGLDVTNKYQELGSKGGGKKSCWFAFLGEI